MHSAEHGQPASNVLILEFKHYHGPEEDPRVVGPEVSDEEKHLILKEFYEGMQKRQK